MGSIRAEPYQNMNISSTAYGKWYFRPFYDQTLDVEELANQIMWDSKVERSRIQAVVSAVIKQIREHLCNGKPIRVPHLGLLKLGVSSKGVATVQEYNAGTDIKNLRILLYPDPEIKKELREMKYVKYIPPKQKTPDNVSGGENTGDNP